MHRDDAARLTCLAAESAPDGSVLHAVGEEGVAYRQIAETIGRHLGVEAVSSNPADAAAHFGFLGHFVGLDTPAASSLTRALLGWEATRPGLIADLDQGHYFGVPGCTRWRQQDTVDPEEIAWFHRDNVAALCELKPR